MTQQALHRIVITGSGSFLAREVLKELEGDPSCAVLRLSRSSTPSFDMASLSADPTLGDVAQALLDFKPTCVLHLAWGHARRTERMSNFHLEENVRASIHLFDFVSRHWPDCRLVGVGSQAEVGVVDTVITPQSDCVPITAYGQGKRLLREYMIAHHPSVGSWIRILTLYGPGDHEEKFVPYLLRCLKTGCNAEISPGEQVWDFLHVSDAAKALVAVAKARYIKGTHVLASGEAWPLKRVAEFVYSKSPRLAQSSSLLIGARPYATHELMSLRGDPSSLIEATGWLPRIGLEVGLTDLVHTYLSEP